MAIIHQIGTPETDSEARAIKRFGKDLPADYLVFHNFEVTTGGAACLLDTHALLWFLRNDPLLSAAAKTLIEDPANRNEPGIVLGDCDQSGHWQAEAG